MKTVLICHEGDLFDRQGLSRWLASFSELVGLIVLREHSDQLKRRVKREIQRSGWLRLADILALRLYCKLFLAKQYDRWLISAMAELERRFGGEPEVPVLVSHNPNLPVVEVFLRELRPDVMIARCKFILKEHIFSIPTVGTFAMHSGICPEYRNAHGCFWALAQRDVHKVGVTLLKVDKGVDTGPVYGYFSYDFDEKDESHLVIQQRCVFENLDAIALKLKEVVECQAQPLSVEGRKSNAWGQPWMSKYVQWKLAARRT
jgi:hypothetical protein